MLVDLNNPAAKNVADNMITVGNMEHIVSQFGNPTKNTLFEFAIVTSMVEVYSPELADMIQEKIDTLKAERGY